MNIIFDQDLIDDVKQKYVVLELETFNINGKEKTAYCVIQPEHISISELEDLQRIQGLHQAIIDAIRRNDRNTILEGISHVRGKFNKELDSFYDHLESRYISYSK